MIIFKSVIKKIVEIDMYIINLYYILLYVAGIFNQGSQLHDHFPNSSMELIWQ
jgi:hypothetical protein